MKCEKGDSEGGGSARFQDQGNGDCLAPTDIKTDQTRPPTPRPHQKKPLPGQCWVGTAGGQDFWTGGGGKYPLYREHAVAEAVTAGESPSRCSRKGFKLLNVKEEQLKKTRSGNHLGQLRGKKLNGLQER